MCVYEQFFVVNADVNTFDVNIDIAGIKCFAVEAALLRVGHDLGLYSRIRV